MVTFTCPIRKCGGELRVDSTHYNQDGQTAVKTRCSRNPGHRYFLVEGREPNRFNRLMSDQRWKGKKV